ncbi:uncharacterized protein LOC108665554 [Hyalella azteca]|uniref:Uncharacterized protein LOC108665554 n=1 Tax=Hyalella azteca TaxID=294128 RepID=A0A979FJI0_HYAAZ|nr:uncharacterized protein LOC108665554 [Hyalella azteca]
MVLNTSFQIVKPLEFPLHADLDEISRCVHFDDFQEAVNYEALLPQPLSNSHMRLQQRVLWFAPSQASTEHNFYGNVSFTIKWKTVLQKLGPNLYLIDQAIYNARSFTRVVFTRNSYDTILTRVDLDSEDSPMTKTESGFRHASHCMNKVRWGPHELQIAIEVTDDDARWLYLNCKPVANNHSMANVPSFGEHIRTDGKESKFLPYKCFKFNTAQNLECPFPWTKSECEMNIQVVLKTGVSSRTHFSTKEITHSTKKNVSFIPSPVVASPRLPSRPATRVKSLRIAPRPRADDGWNLTILLAVVAVFSIFALEFVLYPLLLFTGFFK